MASTNQARTLSDRRSLNTSQQPRPPRPGSGTGVLIKQKSVVPSSSTARVVNVHLGLAALPQLAHLDLRPDLADAAYLATVGVRNAIDRVISLVLGIWALIANWTAMR